MRNTYRLMLTAALLGASILPAAAAETARAHGVAATTVATPADKPLIGSVATTAPAAKTTTGAKPSTTVVPSTPSSPSTVQAAKPATTPPTSSAPVVKSN